MEKILANKAMLFLFWILMVVFLIGKYHYIDIADYGPCSWHGWRQADGLALAINYYEGSSFWEPRTNNLHNAGGEAVSEFPILYYLDAQLWKIFGFHFSIIRSFHLLLLLAGMFSLSLVLQRIYRNFFLAALVPLIIMGTPPVAFYSFNFLPNPVAIGLVMLSIYCYDRFVQDRRLRFFYIAVLLSLLAGLLKITTLISFLAWFATYWVLRWPFKKKEEIQRYFPALRHVLLGFIIVMLGNGLWLAWASHYNEQHDSHLFLMHILPIWEMTDQAIEETWTFIWDHLNYRFFTTETVYIFLAFLLYALFRVRQLPAMVYGLLVFSFLGSLAYVLLFLQQLVIHDYYFIDFMLLPIVICATFFGLLASYHHAWYYQIALALVAFLILNMNVNMVDPHMVKSFTVKDEKIMNFPTAFFDREALWEFQEQIGMEADAHILSLPDPSPNQTLIYLQRKGISNFIMQRYGLGELYFARRRGVKYISIYRIENHSASIPDTVQPLGVYRNIIHFYSLEEVISALEEKRKNRKQK